MLARLVSRLRRVLLDSSTALKLDKSISQQLFTCMYHRQVDETCDLFTDVTLAGPIEETTRNKPLRYAQHHHTFSAKRFQILCPGRSLTTVFPSTAGVRKYRHDNQTPRARQTAPQKKPYTHWPSNLPHSRLAMRSGTLPR